MKIDNTKSSVNFTITKLFFLTVEGLLPEVHGQVDWHESDMAKTSIDLSIPLKGIDTKNAKRNEHLLQEDFFHAAKYPEMTFKSEAIEKKNGQYWAQGVLNIAGNTQNITIPFKFENNRAIGQFSINRMDYKLGKIPSFIASNKVDISFDCSLK